MGDESTLYFNLYRSAIEAQFQQNGSRVAPLCMQKVVEGEFDYSNRINAIDDDNTNSDDNVRKIDTHFFDVSYDRRRINTDESRWSTVVDKNDLIRMSSDPQSAIVTNAVNYLARKADKKVITAAYGTAYSGKAGATSNTFDTSNQRVASNWKDGGATGSDTNLTIAKLRRARKIFDSQEAVMMGEQLNCVFNAATRDSLLRETAVTSSDFNTMKCLVPGEVYDFMGYRFTRSELLPVTTGTIRRVLCFPRSGLTYGVHAGKPLTVDIDMKNSLKNFNSIISVSISDGAVREWEQKVLDILCEETA